MLYRTCRSHRTGKYTPGLVVYVPYRTQPWTNCIESVRQHHLVHDLDAINTIQASPPLCISPVSTLGFARYLVYFTRTFINANTTRYGHIRVFGLKRSQSQQGIRAFLICKREIGRGCRHTAVAPKKKSCSTLT